MRSCFALVFALVLCPALVFAQPLVDRVPADATLYVAWQGIDTMGPGYEQSRLRGLIENSDFRQFTQQLAPALTRLAQRDGPEAARNMRMVGGIMDALWRHPSAFYFVRVNFDEPFPTPQLALISRAGKDADALLGHFQALVAEMKKDGPPFPVEAFRAEDLVGIQIGFQQSAQALAAAGKSIATTDRFKQTMARVHEAPLSIAYLDVESLLAQIERGVQLAGDPQARRMWPVVRDALGLPGLKRAITTGGFDQRDWSTRLFVAAPAPRQGLVALIEPRPIPDALYQRIPASATWAGVGQFDMDRLITQLREIAGRIDPAAPANIDQGLAQIRQMTGVDIQSDFFAALGEHWAAYSDPQNTGRGLLATVIVNRPRKPVELEASLNRLVTMANDTIRQQMRGDDARVRIARTQVGTLNLAYIPLPFVAPTWGAQDGTLYVGLYPQMVAAAATAPAGKSILENPDFVAMQKRLSPARPNHILFMDLPRTAADSYPTLLALSQFVTGLADMAGMDVPPFVVPPLPRLREHLAPAGSAIWVDDEGLHGRSITPFPGAELLGGQGPGFFAAAPALAGVALPALQRARRHDTQQAE